MSIENYVDFSRQDIGQVALDEASSCLTRLPSNKHLWKYAVIAIHNALQCYLSIALRGGSGIDTWKKADAKKWSTAYRENAALPDVQLDYFMDLYDKLFTGKPTENRNLIKFLNATRNEFIHFNSDSYSVDEPSIIDAVTQAIEDIQITPRLSKGIFFYDNEQQMRFDSACNALSLQIKGLGVQSNEQTDPTQHMER